MDPKVIALTEVLKMIKESNGKIFSIKVEKRTDGTIREMVCRTGVTAHLVVAPSKPGINFKKNELISVFDMAKKAYRSIPIEGIKAIKIGGEWIQVEVDVAAIKE